MSGYYRHTILKSMVCHFYSFNLLISVCPLPRRFPEEEVKREGNVEMIFFSSSPIHGLCTLQWTRSTLYWTKLIPPRWYRHVLSSFGWFRVLKNIEINWKAAIVPWPGWFVADQEAESWTRSHAACYVLLGYYCLWSLHSHNPSKPTVTFEKNKWYMLKII